VPALVSVVTPVHPDGAGHLSAAYASLAAQELPAGWSWEWLVQEDGRSGVLDRMLAGLAEGDPRVRPGSGRIGGAGGARTLALARSNGALVRTLDADDLLTPGALGRDVAALCAHPAAGFVTSAALDLLPDGRLVPAEIAQPEGLLVRGSVLAHWRRYGHRLPVHPATLCIRRELVLAVGGWMALPASEDTGLLLAANAVRDGYHLTTPGLHYRKWPGQATAQPAHTERSERKARIDLIDQRATALHELFS
jgi:glycosyltransferase involved in cell wall biosynthesis